MSIPDMLAGTHHIETSQTQFSLKVYNLSQEDLLCNYVNTLNLVDGTFEDWVSQATRGSGKPIN